MLAITPSWTLYYPWSCSIKLRQFDGSLSVLVVHGESELGLDARLESRDQHSQRVAGRGNLTVECCIGRVAVAAIVGVLWSWHAARSDFLALEVVELEAESELFVATADVNQSQLDEDLNRLATVLRVDRKLHLRIVVARVVVGAAAGCVARY